MSNYQPYPEYKDLDLEYLDKIPSGWKISSFKWTSNNGKAFASGPFGSSIGSQFYQDSGIPVIRGNNLSINAEKPKYKDSGYVYLNEDKANELSNAEVLHGDLVFTARGTVGQVGLIPCDNSISWNKAILSANQLRYRNTGEKLCSEFLWYLFSSYFIRTQITLSSDSVAQPNLNLGSLKNLKLIIPSITEQAQIAAFLDHETAKIDTLIEKQQQLIELLKEKRQAVISHAVTKGLNPDVPMKDSGVEWLGEVPEHWCVSRLKYYTKQIVDGAHFTPTYTESGVPFLRVTDIQSKFIDLNQIKYIPQAEHNELIKRCNPKKGDLLLSKNGTIGIPKIVDWDWDFSIFVSLCLLKLKEPLSAEYAEYFFKSHELKEQIFGLIKQSTVINLHLDKIQNFWFCIPPRAEQDEIVASLNRDIGNLDLLINKATDAIHIMQERRTALISAAVTGKIDVRNWVAPATSSDTNEVQQEVTA